MEKGKLFYVTRNYDYDTSPKNLKYAGMSETDWISMIEDSIKDNYETGMIDYMAYIFHDNDFHEKDGSPKPLHVHIIIRFLESTEQNKVIEMFDASSEKNAEKIKSGLRMSKYLIHISDDALEKEKTMYSKKQVKCINCDYGKMLKKTFWDKARNKDSDIEKVDRKQAQLITAEIGQKVRNGEIGPKQAVIELKKKAGYRWVREYAPSFDYDFEQYVKDKVEYMTLNGRDNKNIYIMGNGGIGKTTLATALGERLADGMGLYPGAPVGLGKTPDPLNGYRQEAVAVFNEMSANGWTIDEFLQCFDPYSYSAFPSRNTNRDFIGHTSIFTNSISPLRFAKDLVIYSKGGSIYQDPADKDDIDYENPEAMDKFWQVRRRFNNMIVLLRDENDDDLVNAFVFNIKGATLESGNHVLVGSISFTAKAGGKPELTENALNDLEKLLNKNANNSQTDMKTITDFLDENGLNEIHKDDVIDNFVDDIVSECVWDLLPTMFLYDLYKVYRNDLFSTSKELNVNEFVNKLKPLLTDFDYAQNAVRTGIKMDADEPLLTEYGLDQPLRNGAASPWMAPSYKGRDSVKRRDFPRKNRYRGFVRR